MTGRDTRINFTKTAPQNTQLSASFGCFAFFFAPLTLFSLFFVNFFVFFCLFLLAYFYLPPTFFQPSLVPPNFFLRFRIGPFLILTLKPLYCRLKTSHPILSSVFQEPFAEALPK